MTFEKKNILSMLLLNIEGLITTTEPTISKENIQALRNQVDKMLKIGKPLNTSKEMPIVLIKCVTLPFLDKF
jgi:hypothetical protein